VIQWVHYPLFAMVSCKSFRQYEAVHVRRITMIVAPLMVFELLTSIVLLIVRPDAVSFWRAALACALVVVIWLSIWILHIPAHQRLKASFVVTTFEDHLKTI